MSLSRAPVFSCAHYFQAPATQAIPLLNFLDSLQCLKLTLKALQYLTHRCTKRCLRLSRLRVQKTLPLTGTYISEGSGKSK